MLQRVQKIISNAGYCSRRKAEQLIIDGLVKVNGKVIFIGSCADPDNDTIIAEGRRINASEKIYLAFNKPADCLTTLSDPQKRKTIFDYIHLKERVIPVGRLDYDTQGLLFLTNDGDFANRVMHPRYEVEKTYIVFLDREFSIDSIKKLKKGIIIDDIKTPEAKIRFASPKKDIIELSIHEGQNRIVRRMMHALDYDVLQLIRIKIGNVSLGDIPPGKFRKLRPVELKQFMPKNIPKKNL